MERKFGRYAIKRLTMIMIILIAAGYILMMVVPNLVQYMELNIDSVLHGQVWRLVTWLLIPPSAFNFFTIIMLLFLHRHFAGEDMGRFPLQCVYFRRNPDHACRGLYYLRGLLRRGRDSG